MSILISARHFDPAQAEAIRRERADAGALETVIDFGRGVITTGPWTMPFERMAIPVKTLRRRVDAAIQAANTGNGDMALEPKFYEGRARYLAELIDGVTVQGKATLEEAAGKPVADEKEARDAWLEYCRDAGSTLAQFGMTELTL